MASKKRDAINIIFDRLYAQNPNATIYKFDNDEVKRVTGTSFKNQFDATKFECSKNLPSSLKEHGFIIVHLGSGDHAFVKGEGFHKFEKITDVMDWKIPFSYVDKFSESEAQASSTAFNSKIISDFLLGDTKKEIMIHTARRAKLNGFDFKIGSNLLHANVLQIEMDGIYETKDTIATVEVKNVEHEDFEIRQLFVAMKYFEKLKEIGKVPKEIKVKHLFMIRINKKKLNYFKLYEYMFTDKENPNSIRIVKCKQYTI